jgi:hypothetical protein
MIYSEKICDDGLSRAVPGVYTFAEGPHNFKKTLNFCIRITDFL